MKRLLVVIAAASLLQACATTPRKRFLYVAGIGAGAGALGGAVLSPNAESRGMNALVFALTGAIIGGVTGLFLHDDSELPKTDDSLKGRDLGSDQSTEFVVPAQASALPAYVKDRLQPVVIEEYVQQDSVAEDGSLAEPHRVWRIKRPAELSPKPLPKVKEIRK